MTKDWVGPIGPVDLAAIASEADKRYPNTDDAMSVLELGQIPPEQMSDALLAKLLSLMVSPTIYHTACLRALINRGTWERGVLLHAIERDGENDAWVKRNTMAQKALDVYRTYYPKKT